MPSSSASANLTPGRSLEAGSLEYRQRRDSTSTEFPAAGALEFLRQRLGG
jgi:hypothetical protein